MRLFLAFAFIFAAVVVACSSSSSSPPGDVPGGVNEAGVRCNTVPGSCDAGHPQLRRYDAANHCLEDAPTTLTDVCSTTVNSCYPSAGLGPVCAFAPDGTIYGSLGSDNYSYSAEGWRFTISGLPSNDYPPPSEVASDADSKECYLVVACSPSCSGAPSSLASQCPKDSGAD